MKTWNFSFKEDELFNDDLIQTIERYHDFKYIRSKRHVVIDGLEVDVVAYFVTEHNHRRVVGFELKEHNIVKALEQAFLRAKHFNYFYIVMNTSPAYVFDWIVHYYDEDMVAEIFRQIKRHKIGLICRNQIIIPARYRKIGLELFADFKVEKRGFCKTCKFWERGKKYSIGYCSKHWKRTKANHYCVYYEPRDDIVILNDKKVVQNGFGEDIRA